MPMVPPVLFAQTMSNIANAIKATNPKSDPSSQYFVEMCKAIAFGICAGSPSISFQTQDVGGWGGLLVPVPIPAPGVGLGLGIKLQQQDMEKRIYTYIYEKVKEKVPNTTHDPYPPGPDNSGQYLLAIASGVSKAVTEHYSKFWILNSTHPQVSFGAGIVLPGKLSGLDADNVKSQIMSLSPTLKGAMWPDFAEGIAKGYVESVLKLGTAKVLIVGVPGPPNAGSGNGTAA